MILKLPQYSTRYCTQGTYTIENSINYENGRTSGNVTVGLRSATGNLVPGITVNIDLPRATPEYADMKFNNGERNITVSTKTHFNEPAAQKLLITGQPNTVYSDAFVSHPPVVLDFSVKGETQTSSFVA